MFATRSRIAMLLLAVGLAGLLSAAVRDDRLQAQPPVIQAPAQGRFQISAYSGPSADGANPGCYVVDTATGQIWHVRLGAALVEVSERPLLGGR